MKVADLIAARREVYFVSEEATVYDAARYLRERQVRAVGVCDKQGVLLGVISLRVEGKLEWDAAKGRFTNNTEANKFLKPTYRKGVTLS